MKDENTKPKESVPILDLFIAFFDIVSGNPF